MEMRRWGLLLAALILVVACTCQVPSFLSDFIPSRGTPRGDMIEYDSVVEGTLGADGLQHWSFSGRSGDQITILMESRQIDTFLALFGPDDRFLTVDDDSGGDLNAMIRRFVLPSSGIHNIVATSYSGDQRGEYTLELERTDTGRDASEPAGGTISSGETVNGELLDWTGDAWLFDGSEGDRVTIRLESEEFDTVLELWGPDLARIEEDDDGGVGTNSLIDGFSLPSSGTYNIVARGYNRGEQGRYTLRVE
jgi:serine protease Do